eukprot:NODE_82_length_22708_cov_0.383476.p5 type:complete len:347 gc:universal NODE_82_length_22708_cov_0.383476:8120-7080(-)
MIAYHVTDYQTNLDCKIINFLRFQVSLQMSVKSPSRQFELLKQLESNLLVIKEDSTDKNNKYKSLEAKYNSLSGNYKRLEVEFQNLTKSLETKEPVAQTIVKKPNLNEKSLMNDLEYWKNTCKTLEAKLSEEAHQKPVDKQKDIDHLKLIVGLSTLLDTEDPGQILSKLKLVIQENHKLIQEKESLIHQTQRQKEAHHQYRQINEQLQLGFDQRLSMSKDALKDTFCLLEEKIELVKQTQKKLSNKEIEVNQLRLELDHFKQVHQKLVDEVNFSKSFEIKEMKKLSDKQIRSNDYLVQDLHEKIAILQKDLSNVKQKEYLYNREVAELKRLLNNDNRQWMNDILMS